IDLERSTEFISPDIGEKMRRLREDLGIRYGIHGLCGAMGSKGIFLDSAVKDDYLRTHASLIKDLERSGKLESKYYLQHASETSPYGWLGRDFQSTDLLDIWGRPLYRFLEENPNVLDWLVEQDEIRCLRGGTVDDMIEHVRRPVTEEATNEAKTEMYNEGKIKEDKDLYKPEIQNEMRNRIEKKVNQTLRPTAKKHAKEALLDSLKRVDLAYGPERVAYLATAKWMYDKRDPIWMGVVEGGKFNKEEDKKWAPAVSLKYIWGHFNPKGLEDPKPILEKYNIDFVIETAMVSAGSEEEYRLTNPMHFVILCKNVGTKHFRAAIDFEHILGAGIHPL
ncbi:MAG: hypothetical protein KAW52_08940, partial [candidate division Zixibacteria bacterium]|nr:hypothetical protein [candidate division Zixibacteria bacterium]